MVSFLTSVALVILMLIIGTIGDAMVNATLRMKKKLAGHKMMLQQNEAKKIIKWHEALKDYDRKGYHLMVMLNIVVKYSLYCRD